MTAIAQYAVDGKLGVNVLRVDPALADPNNPTYSGAPQFPLGTVVQTAQGRFIYCQLPALATAGLVCLIDKSTYIAVAATTAAGKLGLSAGVFQGSSAALAGDWGWLQTNGEFAAVSVLTLAAANAALNTTATAGTLDDDATANSFVITGLVINAAQGAGTGVQAGQSGSDTYIGSKN